MTPQEKIKTAIDELNSLEHHSQVFDWFDKYANSKDKTDVVNVALEALCNEGWKPIETAPKDGTPILIKFKNNLEQFDKTEHQELKRWNGLFVVVRHNGISNGFDMGWQVAAPVGHGGFPDAWFIGWKPLENEE